MPFLLSPGVSVTEIDLTTIIPSVSTTDGALSADLRWGPANQRILVESEAELVKWFWKPNSRVADDWLTAWNFLNYGNKLYTVRVLDQDNANTSLRAKNATAANSHGFLVLNDNVYDENYADGSLNSSFGAGHWIAKYAGSLGNSLKVSVCPSANAYQSTLAGTVTITANTATVTGVGTAFTTKVAVGDLFVVADEVHKVKSITNTTQLILRTRHVQGAAAATAVRRWEYYVEADVAPGTSNYAAERGSTSDEMHLVVVDEDGQWTGTNNEVLEVHQNLSKASDAKLEDGSSAYYKDIITNKSKYIRWAAHNSGFTNIGTNIDTTGATAFQGTQLPVKYSLVGGSDGTTIGNDERIRGWDMFKDAEQVDISLLLGAAANQTVAVHLINNVAENRLDCLACLSPPRFTCVDNDGNEADDIVTFRNTLPSTSYAVLDSGWKQQYDKWNDVYRYVPLNGDVAGLMVRTDNTRDPWWSPAGLNRGQIKNVIKLAWNPSQTDRDILYKNGINPVVTFPGDGTVLFGDKTLLAKPSAFDRINVRRLFIVLEKAIARAARYTLFEFNDEFTRSQFRNMVEPYLRMVQGRRGIQEFYVQCDATNNTPEVIDSNGFVASIYIKPARSINFIYLNFVATRTGVEFSEVVGKAGF